VRRFRLIVVGCLFFIACVIVAQCAGIIRPPRPMFHDSYAPVGMGLIYAWIPNTGLADKHGHWTWADETDNLLVVQATGTADNGRSFAMDGGWRSASFRLGSAWDDKRDNQYVTIPRTQNALVVILPDGRWQQFPLRCGQAAAFRESAAFRQSQVGRDNRSVNILQDAGALLDAGGKDDFEAFLKGYVPPEPVGGKAADAGKRSE
jgi:hypothetical protein